ncbi:hypothetical protein RBSWK_02141 [Rhodopirellula baltica SWK14]|uniref:Uncharacterized protein n=1 Tax=Rhodopirellula baltica SWK14 TaxID=993516 RepID=L7CJL9_RHOBT|nr:hypothetical protein RBSWK_02141 [Rhodopirellula baltica SWK14]
MQNDNLVRKPEPIASGEVDVSGCVVEGGGIARRMRERMEECPTKNTMVNKA